MRLTLGLLALFGVAALGACGDNATSAQDASADFAAGNDLELIARDLSSPTCSTDLSNLGTGDFQIAFTLRSTQGGTFALANQRSACSAGNFWDVRIAVGHLEFETDDLTDGAATDAVLTGCATLNSGQPHQVVIQRVGGVLYDYVDGALDGNPVPSTTSFGALAALATGVDVCDGTNGTSRFDPTIGTVSNFCITRAIQPQSRPDGGASICSP
jgi:hypothetical protein